MNSNESIRTFGNAAKLDFSGEGLDSTDAKVLADLLKDNTTAQYLDVSRNDLRAAGAKAFSEMLEVNKTIKVSPELFDRTCVNVRD